jgi:hypothetical protein
MTNNNDQQNDKIDSGALVPESTPIFIENMYVDNDDAYLFSALSLAPSAPKFFVIAGNATTKGFYTNNGVTWTESNLPYAQHYWYAMAADNEKYLVGGLAYNPVTLGDATDKYFYSYDGENWTESNFPYPIKYNSILYASGKFIVPVNNTAIAFISNDGFSWNQISLPDVKYSWLMSFTTDNNKFFLTGNDGTIYVSSDGLVWSTHVLNNGEIYRGTYGHGIYVIPQVSSLSTNISDGKNLTLSISNNLNSWYDITIYNETDFTNFGYINNVSNAIYANGKFYFFVSLSGVSPLYEATTRVYSSSNGINWDYIVLDQYYPVTVISYADNTFIGLGWIQSFTLISSDGITWNEYNNVVANSWWKIQPNVNIPSTPATPVTPTSSLSVAGYFAGGFDGFNQVATADKLTYSTDTIAAQTSGNLSLARQGLAGVSEGSTKG